MLDLPERKIVKQFYAEPITEPEITPLGNGLVNTTYLVSSSNETSVLQKISPNIPAEQTLDYTIVSDFLNSKGWELPTIRKTLQGYYYFADEQGNNWRLTNYLSSTGTPNSVKMSGGRSYGSLLASLHLDLSLLEHVPSYQIPNFHDTAYYAKQLEVALPHIPNETAQKYGEVILCCFSEQRPLEAMPEQLIHGDPKLDNILHRNGVPFTLIDWDTLMIGNPLVDLGDMLRSLTPKFDSASSSPLAGPLTLVDAYYEKTKPRLQKKSFRDIALRAGMLLSLELAMRYLADYDSSKPYFNWDKEKYKSHYDSNFVKSIQTMRTVSLLSGVSD
jgi:thiamine kinase-like enzyme